MAGEAAVGSAEAIAEWAGGNRAGGGAAAGAGAGVAPVLSAAHMQEIAKAERFRNAVSLAKAEAGGASAVG